MTKALRKYACGAALIVGVTMLWPQAALAQKHVLRLCFDGPVLEAPTDEMDLAVLFGQQKARTLRDWVSTIERAAADEDVDGIIMIVEEPAVGFAQVEELTRALKAFRQSGKKIYCYMDWAGNASYALAAAANHVTLAEHSVLGTVGLHAEATFFKGLLDKIGVEADVMHCGAYKSAVEPFTRTEPSKEAAEQINWLLDGIFERFVQLLAQERGLSVEQVKAAINAAPLDSDQVLEHKLVDAIGSFPEFKQMIHKEFGKDVEVIKKYSEKKKLDLDFGDGSNPFEPLMKLMDLFRSITEEATAPAKPGIGLIYIEGLITVGKNEPDLLFGGNTAGSTTIRAAFEQARQDESVRAVVVRVDSPGGSALASDIMWEAATRCGKEKPLIVSMGGVAGSGGYYVSIPGDTIFAEETTITGSIGVVGGKFVWKDLMEAKLGITTTEFDRGKHAGLMSMNRPWDDDERAWMTNYMNAVYGQFKDRVRESRGERIKGDLEQLAGGRVYTGRQALELGLIDQLGGLSDAIEFAAKKADLAEYEIYLLPERKEFFEKMLEALLDQETEDEWEVRLSRPLAGDPLTEAALPLLRGLAPEKLRRIVNGLRNAVMLHREHVGCFMPFDLEIR
jgi:protease-4